MFYASYGSFIHNLLEDFYKGFLTKEEMKIVFLRDFSKRVLGERPAPETVAKYIESGISYLDKFSPLPYELVGVEKEVHFLLGDTPFVGFIDYLGRDENGALYIVDNKSRNLKPRSNRKKPTVKDKELDEMLRQLYIYSAGIKSEFGVYPKALCFNCFRNGVFIEEPFSEDAYNDAICWALDNINEIKDTEDFHPNIEYMQCRYLCGLNDRCCYWNERGNWS